MDFDLRHLDGDRAADVEAFQDLDDAAFSNRASAAEREVSAGIAEWPAFWGAFGPDGRLWGSAGSFAQELTVVGGGRLPVAGVTAVGVDPTRRRRGVLTALMGAQLEELSAQGVAVAVLTASETTIYRRFGYGVASRANSVRLDRHRSTLAEAPSADVDLRLVHPDEAAGLVPVAYADHAASCVGAVSRPASFWPFVLGPTETWVGGGDDFTVVAWRRGGDEPDRPTGYARYRVDHTPPTGQWTLKVGELAAADPDTESHLWRYLLDLDLTATIEVRDAPLDDPLAWRLADWRAYQVTGQHDHLWVRLIDPEVAWAARAAGSDEALVVEVTDRYHPLAAGCYRAVGQADGTTQVERGAPGHGPGGAVPDLVLDVADLGSLWLGAVSATTLARAGRLRPRSAEALTRADRLLASARPPFCIVRF